MKLFLKILAGFLGGIILIVAGINMYFTDARLKALIIPQLNDVLGREVRIEHLSLSIVKTFPSVGLVVEGLFIPDDAGEALFTMEELVIAVNLAPLLIKKVEISEIRLTAPEFIYRVDEQGKSNIDSLLAQFESEETEQESSSNDAPSFDIDLELFRFERGRFGYEDAQNKSSALIENLSGTTTVSYGSEIESTLKLNIGGLSFALDGEPLLTRLPVQMNQTSVINLNEETLHLTKGGFAIKGLGLEVKGEVAQFLSDHPKVELHLTSSAEDLGSLLSLVPASMADLVEGLQTKGALSIKAMVQGELFKDDLPKFNAAVELKDGFINNPDTPEPIQNIHLSFTASNEVVEITRFSAEAAGNFLTAKAQIMHPLDEDAAFSFSFDGKVDLSTANKFADLKSFDIETLRGLLTLKGTGKGTIDVPENAQFDVAVRLERGFVKHKLADSPIDEIAVQLNATNSRVDLRTVSVKAATNHIDLSGVITHPLEEAKTAYDVNTKARLDLASIKKFYPIDEDTLKMRGQLLADLNIKGLLSKPEEPKARGEIRFENGFIQHRDLPKPIDEITLLAVITDKVIELRRASLKTGTNSVKANGTIREYLSEIPQLAMKVQAEFNLAEVPDFVDVKPYVSSISGKLSSDLSVSGPATDPEKLSFNGGLKLRNMAVEGDSLPQPIKDLSVDLNFSNKNVTLGNLSFLLGSSDIRLNGSLDEYMILIEENPGNKVAQLSGTYHSKFLNLDELIDWTESTEEENEEPTLLEIPPIHTRLTARVDSMLVYGVPMTQLTATVQSTRNKVSFTNASVRVSGGEISGKMDVDILRPERTRVNFNGAVESVLFEVFFKEYQMMGKNSTLHENISGSFSAKANFVSELDSLFNPDLASILSEGTFGMTKSRMKDHPIQNTVATFLGAPELRNMVLDDWKAKFTIKEGIFTITDMNLTSGEIGLSLNGTSDLIQERVNFKARLFLPGSYGDRLARIITRDAVEALKQDNGTIMVPLVIRGPSAKPSVSADQDIMKPLIERYLKRKVGGAIRNLIGG